MKKKQIAVVLGMVMAGTVWGQESRPVDPLHAEMEAMGKAFKAIKGQVSDAGKNEETAALVVELERHTMIAKGLVPRGAATRPAEERAKYVASFRVDMANLLRMELELEEAVVDGHNDKAAEAVKTIGDIVGEGHREFRPKRKRP